MRCNGVVLLNVFLFAFLFVPNAFSNAIRLVYVVSYEIYSLIRHHLYHACTIAVELFTIQYNYYLTDFNISLVLQDRCPFEIMYASLL